ncbi:serine/threonine-protein kinase VIK [Physcomitrium patens]|uniref:non-specific serine/threonine protein kinase n=1 Tax=Physcomitrium patens TaxID=3218 RepID=A9TYQ5_PHYPA|nr:integrin-linked protein kinase 1-like [Physcomitrium patens]PNR37611.1 hypothetical protein PHYPA_020720 [Physcomitrium patens]|eukprot:XP_024397964.1 integrin-linked protein kinase 1-like [Physcomitrella patens]
MGDENERALAQVHWAVRNDDADALKKLLDEGDSAALVNAADYDKRTPLHVAASSKSLSAAVLLLSAGAWVDPVDRRNNTPLAYAQKSGFKSMVKLLTRYGAQPVVDPGRKGDEGGNLKYPPQSWDWLIDDPSEINMDESVLIGKGSFGEIRQANWRGTKVAVKTIRPSLSKDREVRKDFLNEVELLVKLRHPNIVQFLAAVINKPPLMLVTEYLPGGDLHRLIQKGPVPADLAVALALDMARGMAYLHGGPNVIIHRDLKPRNLIIDEANELKVGDFGLSKLIKVANIHEAYKLTGETGSYRYMAPEVFLRQNYNTKVDVFSFAMILYEMFEGASPFSGYEAYDAASKVARENLRPDFDAKIHYPDGMRELITECWSEFPEKRPQFDDIVRKIEQIQEKTSQQDRHCFRHLLQRIHRHHSE